MFKKNTLYNIIFPIWFIPYLAFFMPKQAWGIILIVLVGNFLIDSIIYLISLKAFKIENKKEKYKKGIIKIWLFGFLADIIGGIIMFIPMYVDTNSWIYDNLSNPLMMNLYSSIYSVIWALLALAVSAFCIYFFNYKFTFRKTDMDVKIKKKIALYIALITAPYLFLVPLLV